jgi:signal transduction histidine kinase/CheY-like chemotaxis protein
MRNAEAAAPAKNGEGRARSGRWQRAPLIALAAAVLLLAAGLILAITNERAFKAQKIDEVTVEGRFLALIVSPALEFHDHATAQEYVDALKANPELDAAAIYDAEGRLFASSRRDGAPPLPTAPPAAGAVFAGHRLAVTVPVVQDGSNLGTVYLDTVTEPVWSRLQRYVGIGILVTMAALLVVGLGSAYAALTRAHAELERRAVDLAEANRQLHDEIEEREKAEEALRQSQKMEAIGQLTGGVAHDFNNLLTVVAGNLDLIERLTDASEQRSVPKDRLRRLVEAAQRGLARGSRLTRQLLAFSRQEPLAARTVAVNAMLADFAPLIERALGETIELHLLLCGDESWCKLDPAQFEAAVLNLAINARDATDNGGSLTIATRREPPSEASPPQIVLSVADTGSGMPAEVLRRIFEPFYTTKPVGAGSGLGLAQVWAFVTQSGGRVEVASEPGRGTTFELFLPLSPEAADALDGDLPLRAETGGSERILVVEDEDDVREVAAATLERLGYHTIAARDGRDALAILNRSAEVDLLFTDYVMPNGLNGAQLAREALRLRPRLKVLVTSGYARQASAGAGNLSVDDFPMIAKPYRSADLAARIREILDAAETEPAG